MVSKGILSSIYIFLYLLQIVAAVPGLGLPSKLPKVLDTVRMSKLAGPALTQRSETVRTYNLLDFRRRCACFRNSAQYRGERTNGVHNGRKMLPKVT